MSSGVQVADSSKNLYNAVKMNVKGQAKFNFAVFKISDDLKEIVPDTERQDTGSDCKTAPGEQPEQFKDLVGHLPPDDGRYIVYDYPYQGSFGPTSKIILVMWCPGGVPIKRKMLYASSKDALRKCFNDVGGEFQADCAEDLSHKDIEAKLKKV